MPGTCDQIHKWFSSNHHKSVILSTLTVMIWRKHSPHYLTIDRDFANSSLIFEDAQDFMEACLCIAIRNLPSRPIVLRYDHNISNLVMVKFAGMSM